ncbi:DUF4912 domain-containing protein [bacterium]
MEQAGNYTNTCSSFLGYIENNKIDFDKYNSIPDTYNETKISILQRDPCCIFTYWEINEAKQNEFKDAHGDDIFIRSKFVLRVNQQTPDNKNNSFYVDAYLNIMNWYINIDCSLGRNICVDMGLLTENGEFILIASSNIIKMSYDNFNDIYLRQKGRHAMDLAGGSSLSFQKKI